MMTTDHDVVTTFVVCACACVRACVRACVCVCVCVAGQAMHIVVENPW